MNSQIINLLSIILSKFNLKNPIDLDQAIEIACKKINNDWILGYLNPNMTINAIGYALRTLSNKKIGIIENTLNIDDFSLVKRRAFREDVLYQKQSYCPAIIIKEERNRNKFYVITEMYKCGIFTITADCSIYMNYTKEELLSKFQKCDNDYTSLKSYNLVYN